MAVSVFEFPIDEGIGTFDCHIRVVDDSGSSEDLDLLRHWSQARHFYFVHLPENGAVMP